jgi:hypothetical protein
MRRALVVAALAALWTLAFAGAAGACTCIGPNPICQAYWNTEVVFDATVVAIQPTARTESLGDRDFVMPEKLVSLTVLRGWKGIDAPSVEVVTAAQGSACGFNFEIGTRYLVFAAHRPADGRLEVSSCGRTRAFTGRGEDAEFLDSLSRPATGGRIFGSVRLFERRLSRGPSTPDRPFETEIRLTGDGRVSTTKSTGGRYEFRDLSAGRYQLNLSISDAYTAGDLERQIDIPNDRACAQEEFGVMPNGRISGQLVGANGRPLPDVDVELTSAAESQPEVISARTDANGFFEFERLSPGRYIVGLNLGNAGVSEDRPYARTTYPGRGEDPQVLDLRLGETVNLPAWRVPPPAFKEKAPDRRDGPRGGA